MKLFNEMYYLFGKYGMFLGDGENFRLEKMVAEELGSDDKIRSKIMEIISLMEREKLFCNFYRFSKKMEINENWNQAPDWFLQSLEIEIKGTELVISTQKGSAFLEYNVGYRELELEPYFFKKASEEFESKRKMEKIFLPQTEGEDQRRMVREVYRMIEEEIKESAGMENFNFELKQLLEMYLKQKEKLKENEIENQF